jgi:hypothetical protein
MVQPYWGIRYMHFFFRCNARVYLLVIIKYVRLVSKISSNTFFPVLRLSLSQNYKACHRLSYSVISPTEPHLFQKKKTEPHLSPPTLRFASIAEGSRAPELPACCRSLSIIPVPLVEGLHLRSLSIIIGLPALRRRGRQLPMRCRAGGAASVLLPVWGSSNTR